MTFPSFAESRESVVTGVSTCAGLVETFLARIEAEDVGVNAFISVDDGGARRRASELDRIKADLPLKGMVVGVKDTIAVAGQRLTCGSRMLADFRSLYSATAVERLEAAGAIVIGKLNCDEFAMGSSNEASAFGPVRNPLDPERVPGGSSGGSAAAVAAGFCHASLGSDTGGSIRLPAAYCGLVGLKPTYGRVSRYGLVAYASSLDCIGPLARSVEDVAVVFATIAGPDPNDSTSARVDVPSFPGGALGQESLAGLKVGFPAEYLREGLDPEVARAVEAVAATCREAGAEVVEVSLPHTRFGIATYYILATAEASSNLGRYDGVRFGHRADVAEVRRLLDSERKALEAVHAADGDDARLAAARRLIDGLESPLVRLYAQTRTEGFGEEVKRRIMLGTYVLSSGYYEAYYARAQRVRTLIRRDFESAFAEVDLLLTPAAPSPAFRLGERMDDPLRMYLSDVHTVTANLAGIPGLVLPAPNRHSSGMPIGVQFLAPWFDEARLLHTGAALERIWQTLT